MSLRSSVFARCSAAWVLTASLSGCASSPASPVVLRPADFGRTQVPAGHPIVIAFKAGDRIPVVFDVTGEIIEITPRPSELWLTAKRDFFLRVGGSKLETSLDGVHYGHPREPGSFRFGYASKPGGGFEVQVAIRTPVHAQ
jgi:hypothetical protein